MLGSQLTSSLGLPAFSMVCLSRYLSILWLAFFIGILDRVEGQLGLYKLDVNPDAASGVYVVITQGDGYARDDTLAMYNGTIEQPLMSYTFCHRFQLYYTRPRMYLTTYAYSNEDTNELYSEYHLGRSAFRVCKIGTKYCSWHYELPPFNFWRHICLTYDAFRDVYKLYVDGEKVDSGSFAGDNAPEPIRPNGIFVIGQDQDEMDGGYNKKQSWSGAIAQYNLWDFVIEDYDISNMAECRSDVFGNLVKWHKDNWIERNVDSEMVPTFQLCGNAEDEAGPSLFLFPEEFDFFFYNSFCVNLGGEMPALNSEEEFHELMDNLEGIINPEIHEKCMHASGNLIVWVAATDEYEEGVWVNPQTKIPMNFDGFWETGQPNGAEGENCARTYIDRRWQDQDCASKFCAVCKFERKMNLTMRGLCPADTKLMEGFFDVVYFIQGFEREKAHWRGGGKSHIFYKRGTKSWRLESFYDVERFAELAADDSVPRAFYPLGRNKWQVSSGICQLENNVRHQLTLTNCEGGMEFTCDDGTCVRINQRCNLITDCPDFSDEKNCDILKIDDDYRMESFPRSPDNKALLIYITVSILALPKIDTLDLSFTADFDLTMIWVDPRLNFYDLRGATDLNSLSNSLQERIWSPSLSFTNAKIIGGTKVDPTVETVIERNGKPAPDNIIRAVEANVYSGVDSNIIMKREYFIDWACDYDLIYFPFDTQVCKMVFDMTGGTKEYLRMAVDENGVEYLGEEYLLEYRVGGMLLKEINDSSAKYSSMKVSLILTRRWFYHGISVFLQSILLLIVAYMTFYYRVDNFQDRVMVSITCMLVIANVQSSINEMVPKTSYLKMIDYFLIYSFNIIIVVMAYHTYQAAHVAEDFSPNENDKAMERLKKLGPGGDRGSSGDKNKLWNSFFVEGGEPVDKLADAKRINKQGQIIFVVAFVVFQFVFWVVGLVENLSEKDVHKLTKQAEYYEDIAKQKIL